MSFILEGEFCKYVSSFMLRFWFSVIFGVCEDLFWFLVISRYFLWFWVIHWHLWSFFLWFSSISSYMLDLLGFVWIYIDLWVCHALWWIYYDSCGYNLIGWYVLLNLFSFCIYGIFVFFYVIFAPIVCVCKIVIVDILLCGWHLGIRILLEQW